jgi:hypothetical protein
LEEETAMTTATAAMMEPGLDGDVVDGDVLLDEDVLDVDVGFLRDLGGERFCLLRF